MACRYYHNFATMQSFQVYHKTVVAVHAPFSSLVDGWPQCLHFRPLRPHLNPFPPASPCLPPRADTRHVARPMTARPLPIRRPALTVRLPYSTQATFGGGLFPPPLLSYTPGFGNESRPSWPGVVCCPHPPGAALLPGRKVLGPTLQPMDKSTLLPLFICHHPPLSRARDHPVMEIVPNKALSLSLSLS